MRPIHIYIYIYIYIYILIPLYTYAQVVIDRVFCCMYYHTYSPPLKEISLLALLGTL